MPGVRALVVRRIDGEIRSYDAIQAAVGRAVVVQVAPQGTAAAGILLERARTFALLDRHPSLPVVHDVGVTPGGWVFVVRSGHQGQTLGQRLEAQGALTMLEAIEMGADVAAALEVLHAGGLVHGMVGPEAITQREGGGWLLDEPLSTPSTPTIPGASEDVRDLASTLERAVGGLALRDESDELSQVVMSALSPLAAERPSAGEMLRLLRALSARLGDQSRSTAATASRTAKTAPNTSASTKPRTTARHPGTGSRRARMFVAGGVIVGLAAITGAAIEFRPNDLGAPPAAPVPANSEPVRFPSSSPTSSPSPTFSVVRALAPYEKKRRPGDLVWDGRYYWWSQPAKGTVSRTSSFRGKSDTKEVRAGREPGALAVGDGVIWVANTRDGTVLGLDRDSLEQTARITVGGTPTGIAVSSTYLWVVDHAAGELVRVDLRNQSQIQRVAVGRHPFEVEVARGIVWVTVGGEDRLARVEAGTMEVSYVGVGQGPAGLDIAFGSVWVANHKDGTWTQVDEESASVIRTGVSGRGPFAVSAGRPARARGGYDEVVMIANDRSLNVRLIVVSRGRVVASQLTQSEPRIRSQQRRDMVAVDNEGGCSITTDERRYQETVICEDNG